MPVVLARIDNRLIHGQVLEAWVPHLHADCIVVANDAVAAVPLQRSLMAAAVPRGIKVMIGRLDEVGGELQKELYRSARVLVLFETSEDAVRGLRAGIPFDRLNLGNMHAGSGKLRCSCTISLDQKDISCLQQLEEGNVTIVSQCIPADRQRPWRKLLNARGEGSDGG